MQETEAVPTSFTDIFYYMDPANPPRVNARLRARTRTVTDQNDDGDIGTSGGDRIGNSDIVATYPGDVVTIRTNDGTIISYTGVTFYLANGREVFSPIDGQNLVDGRFVSSSFVVTDAPVTPEELEQAPCFTPGTHILTPRGHRRVEDLQPGDLVITQDRGERPVRWVGKRKVDGVGQHAPIRFEKRTIGNRRALTVSPQHRILLTGWRAQLHFGEDEILVAAAHLVDGVGITVRKARFVEYIHLMFDQHEVIFAEGVATESFHPGDRFLDQDTEVARELGELFPELRDRRLPRHWDTARTVLRGFEAKVFAA